MATVSAKCSCPGSADYHMQYTEVTVNADDYSILEGVEGDSLVGCLQYLATRQMLLWQVAIGFLTPAEFSQREKFAASVLVPKQYRETLCGKVVAS